MCYEVPEMYLRLWSNLIFNFILINLNWNSLLWLVAVLESCQVSFSNLKKKKKGKSCASVILKIASCEVRIKAGIINWVQK